MAKTVKGRLKLKMREKIAKKRNHQIVQRLNEFLADPSSEVEASDSMSEDEEKGKMIKELKKSIQAVKETKKSKQDQQIVELQKELEHAKAGIEYVKPVEQTPQEMQAVIEQQINDM